ncbi:pectinesterase family protein [Asticcacaulis biprosthecium]|nr:pectinesterase family protein [Asticcacaulis biprosthecium]
MKKLLVFVGLLSIAFPALAANPIPVDDSYTVSQRWDGYKGKYPGIALPEVAFEAGQQVQFDRLYKKADDRELHIDVFLPVKGNGQGILLVHGGGWRSGNKSHFYSLANRLAQRGYTVFLPEFRLSAEAKYPAGLVDVNDAIVWVKSQGYGIDRLAIGGASSGGQMAALLAYTAGQDLFKGQPGDTSVNALIDLDGVLDFTTPMALQYENKPNSVASQWLGGSFEQAPDTWRQASAATHVSAKSPPTLIISSGLMRFTAGREDVAAKLAGFGIRHHYLEFSEAPHDVWLFDPWFGQIVDRMDVFLQSAAEVRYEVSDRCAARPNCFGAIQAAVDAAGRDTGGRWAVIDIAAGDYYEKVTVTRSRVRLRGQGVGKTRLYFDAVAQTAGKYHRNNWGTPGSATLTIDADQVDIEGMTIENSFDYLANDALPDGDAAKIGNSQGVTLLLDIHSDRVRVAKSALVGNQDTLFANGGRVWIRDSSVSGNIDFIFGNGRVLIEASDIITRRRAAALKPGDYHSFIAAPSTQLTQAMGIVIYRSRLMREPGVPDASVALGRPWHPTTTFADGRYADPNAVGQASFLDCWMDAHIHPDHWTVMNGTARDGTKTAVFRPQDSRFFEMGSQGPGARHNDIGIVWQGGLGIDAVRKAFFEGWPQP